MCGKINRAVTSIGVGLACTGLLIAASCDRSSDTHAPPPSSSTGTTCAEHLLPADRCPFCDADLIPREGPCREHGVPEALCWICRPQLVRVFEKLNDWCGGHDRPESLCFICNPEREAIYAAIMIVGGGPRHDDAPRDFIVESVDAAETPRSQRAPSVTCTTSDTRVRLASPDTAHKAGFEYAAVARREISRTLQCNTDIAYDANHYARVASRVSGVIQAVKRDLGEVVRAGDVLAVVDSAQLASAKAEYLQAVEHRMLWEKNHHAVHELVERGIAGKQEDLAAENKLAEADIEVSKARQHLRVLGLSDTQIEGVVGAKDISPLLSLTAPFDGEIVERLAVVGETVDSSRPLFAIADTGVMWAMLDVYERDIALVRVGQPVVVTVDGLRGETFAGRVMWISRQIDPRTRTLHARAELDNSAGVLRANMFGRAEITIHDREPLVVVPRSAVQWDGCCNIAFVRQTETLFEPRKLRLGIESGDLIEVREGLAEGETIVTQGSFLLKTEIMKGSIGAGCCEPVH